MEEHEEKSRICKMFKFKDDITDKCLHNISNM